VQRLFPIPLDADSLAARAIREGRVLQVPDTEAPDTPSITRESGRVAGFRTQLTVPMLHDGRPIGSINVMRPDPGPFSDNQISLLQTFADQAVIAIENVRLFTELQEKNRALTEALDQQTATSEVLKIISRSTFDLLPVLEILVENATRLCGADWGTLYRLDGEVLRPAAFSHASPEYIQFWRATELSPGRGSCAGRAALERRTIHIADVLADPEYELTENQRRGGFRGLLSVPLLREGMLIGVITMARNEVRPFTENQIALLQTFADQAVIAIENVRLLSELQARTQELTRSVGELTALGDVGRALSSTLDLDAVLQTIVTRASQLAGTDACSVFEYDEETEAFHLRATNNLDEEVVALARRTPTRKGEGVQGRMAVTRQPVQVPDIAQEDAYHGPLREILLRTGTRAVLAVPMLRENELIGGLTVNKRTPGPFSPATIDLLTTFATQSALAIQNARLFREIELKSRELEAASQHKSEFLANMSHELRTPLNAVIGFSEVLTERMFGELNEKQDEYLKDIHASGQHLLSLINDILDLSKIEAGRMELEVADFDLPMTIDNALMLVRERAARRNIALRTTVDERLGQVHADERKIRQVLLNLLSNAIKFTPEGGRIHVEARPVNESIEVSVTDTGVGIAAEDQEAVFEEFRQVGTADKKVEGTGLGLALSRKFVELHGGKMWVKSQVGAGSTFTFAVPVPVRRGE
jgi:two-component system, NtrC family, sensor kinase